MKKFFALMLVVAMLSVAGSAMAVTVKVSGDLTTVAMYPGDTTAVTVLVSADHPKTGVISSIDLKAAPTWATSSDKVASGDNYYTMKVTFKPATDVKAGNYTATVSAYEKYISGDLVGHTPSYTVSDSVKITAIVLNKDEKAVEVKDVPVIKESLAVLADIAVVQDTQSTVTQLVGETKTKVANALASILSAVGIKVDVNTAVLGGSNVQKADESWKADIAVAAAKLKRAAGDGALVRAAGAYTPFKAIANAFQALGLPTFASIFYNQEIGMDLGEEGTASSAFFASAATGTNQVVFLNSLGQQVTKVPDGTHGETAGKVTAVAYVEAGKTYEPLIFTKFASKASMDAFDSAAGTKIVDKVVIVVESDEPTPPTPVVDSKDVWSGDISLQIADGNKQAIEALLGGVTLKRLSLDNVGAAQKRADSAFTINGVYHEEVALIPHLVNLANNAANEKYVVGFKYEKLANSRSITGAPRFSPNGTTLLGNIYTVTGTTTRTARAAAASDVYTGNIGYLVFAVSNDVVVSFSAATTSFDNPRLIAPSSSDVPTPSYPEGTSSSSGGCSAGSAALALAVLGSFILTRKK